MFSAEDFDIVRLEEVQQAIEANISRTPTDIALDRRVPYAAVVATQVKRLQRAKSKLPSYYAVRACLPPLSYEQSSSEECAVRKPLSGGSLLDLTCGLGVDAAMLSRRFERVVTCERNEVLAEVARENFARLGCHNIEV
ncbi:MAG: SAM-dependent methyltransferase, partial [Alistipes sp.]|nr:SAM-dependent methyltransferase [Alistipes sp.]